MYQSSIVDVKLVCGTFAALRDSASESLTCPLADFLTAFRSLFSFRLLPEKAVSQRCLQSKYGNIVGHGKTFDERSDKQQKADGKLLYGKPVRRMPAYLAVEDAAAGIIRLGREAQPDIDLDILESAYPIKDFGSDLDEGRERPQGGKKASSDADLTSPRNSRVRRLSSAIESQEGLVTRATLRSKELGGFLHSPSAGTIQASQSVVGDTNLSSITTTTTSTLIIASFAYLDYCYSRFRTAGSYISSTPPSSRSTDSSIRGTQPPHSQQCCAP
jgi:hypothetical protein